MLSRSLRKISNILDVPALSVRLFLNAPNCALEKRNTFVFRTRLSLLIIIISRTGFHLIHGTLIGDRKQLPIICQSDRLISCKSECIPALWLVYGWKYWVPMLEGHKHLFSNKDNTQMRKHWNFRIIFTSVTWSPRLVSWLKEFNKNLFLRSGSNYGQYVFRKFPELTWTKILQLKRHAL